MGIDGLSRRQRLKHATLAAHHRLDGLIDSAGLLDSRARYELYLRATWAARRPAEQALDTADVVSLYAAWPRRRICDALRKDVFDVSQIFPGEPATAPIQLLGKAQSLGVLYVLEGSALGARVLGTRAATIGMTARFGGRHLAHQTSQPHAWAEFIELLTQTKLTGADEDQCVAAAIATFLRYEQAFAHLATCQ